MNNAGISPIHLLLFATLVSLAGCGAPPEAAKPQPPQVVVATPTVRDVTLVKEFTGNTVGYETAEIRARIEGFVEEIRFDASSLVDPGDELFLIEPDTYEANRRRAEALLLSAQAAFASAESELERLEQALEQNAVSQVEVTRKRAERDQAEAEIFSAEAALVQADIDLNYATVTAPIGGVIGRNLVDVGTLVGAGSATHLATVVRIDPIYAYFDMDERTVAEFLRKVGGILTSLDSGKEGDAKALLYLEGTEVPFEGYMDYIDNKVDPNTGTIQVRAVFENEGGILLPGFFVRIRMPTDTLEDAVLVEEMALSTDLGGRFLMIVGEGNVVERRYVDPGPLQDDGKRVILEGLKAGESYILKGLQRARPGMPVTPASGGGAGQ